MKACRGTSSIAPLILTLGIRWRWVVNFSIQPPYPPEKTPDAHWIGGWVGPQTPSEGSEEAKKFVSPVGIRTLYRPVHSFVTKLAKAVEGSDNELTGHITPVSVFTVWGKTPNAHWIRGWVGPQTPSERSEEAIDSFLLSGLKPFIVQSTDLSLNWLKLLKEAITNWLATLRQYPSLRSEEKQSNFDSCWDLNRDVQEYEAGVPPSLPQSSVLGCHSTVSDTHLKMEKISTPETSRSTIRRGISKGNGDRKIDAMIWALKNANEWTFKSHRNS